MADFSIPKVLQMKRSDEWSHYLRTHVSAPQQSAAGLVSVQRLGCRWPAEFIEPQCWQLLMEMFPNVKEQFSGGVGPGRSAAWQAAAQQACTPPAVDESRPAAPRSRSRSRSRWRSSGGRTR